MKSGLVLSTETHSHQEFSEEDALREKARHNRKVKENMRRVRCTLSKAKNDLKREQEILALCRTKSAVFDIRESEKEIDRLTQIKTSLEAELSKLEKSLQPF